MTTKGAILAVDDAPAVLKLLEEILTFHGYQVRCAASGEQALTAVAANPPDLILLDIFMPRMDGLAVCRKLKAREETRRLPVILISGLSEVDAWVQGLQLGAVDFIAKPFQPEELLARVATHLSLAQQAATLRQANDQLHAELTACQRTGETLRKIDDRFKKLFLEAPLGIALIDSLTGHIYEVNPMFAKIAGRTEEELVRLDWMSITHPDDIQKDMDHMARLNAGTIARFQMDKRYLHPDGTAVWIHMTIVPMKADTHAHPRHLCMIEDITARKQAEDELRESQARLARAEAFSQVMVTHVGLDGRWLKVPPLLCQLLNYSEADLLARRVQDVTLPEYALADWAQYQRLLQSDLKSFSADKRFCGHDGQTFWLSVNTSLVTDAHGTPVHFLTYLRDITAPMAAMEHVRAQAQLLDLAPDAILVRDLTGSIRYWNLGAQQIYGWTAAEAIGGATSGPATAPEGTVHPCLAQVLQTGEWNGELEKPTKAGTPVTVLSRWKLLRDPAGRPQSFLVVETDISMQKKLEAQFLRAQRMEAVGALAGGIAHDLNNVLAPILLSLQILRGRLNDELDVKLLASMESSAQRGADLVRQVLSFARGIEGQRFVVNPNHLVRDIRKITKETFPVNIAFAFQSQPELWNVTGDPTQLHQVLMNLCVNARDAMPSGGKLTLTMENLELDELQASMHPESKPGPYVLLTVSDTGAGIPKAIQHKIFEPFFTTKETGKGTGLGLSTTASIVRSHGGFLHLYSEPGRGATFKIYLPANPTAVVPEVAAIEPPSLPRGNGELVLMVDDEESIRTAIQKTLEIFGYRVLLAIHGAEAVALYAQHRHDIAIVITDMAMPVMDGPATIAALKMMNPAVKIIGSSGMASSGGAAKAVAAGVIHFVPKPYTAETMLKVLAQALHGPITDD